MIIMKFEYKLTHPTGTMSRAGCAALQTYKPLAAGRTFTTWSEPRSYHSSSNGWLFWQRL